MGKALHVTANLIQAIGTATFGGICGFAAQATESVSQISFRQAGTFSLLGFNNISGGGANTVNLRVGGATGNNSVTLTGAGWAEESAANTDTISANTLVSYNFIDTGTDPTYGAFKVVFQASGDHCQYLGGSDGGAVYDVASATRYLKFAGELFADGGTVVADTQFKSRATGTLRSFQVNVSANARTNTSSFKTDIGGTAGNGLVEYASGATGIVVDDTHTDTLADGTLFCASLTLLTGVQDLTVTTYAAAVTHASSPKSELVAPATELAGTARTASATNNFMPLGGDTSWNGTGAETGKTIKPGFAGTASKLRIYLSANAYTANATLSLRKNGADAIATTITASGGAGWYENTSDTATFTATDDLCLMITGGTSGDITIQHAMVTIEDTSGGAATILPPGKLIDGILTRSKLVFGRLTACLLLILANVNLAA